MQHTFIECCLFQANLTQQNQNNNHKLFGNFFFYNPYQYNQAHVLQQKLPLSFTLDKLHYIYKVDQYSEFVF